MWSHVNSVRNDLLTLMTGACHKQAHFFYIPEILIIFLINKPGHVAKEKRSSSKTALSGMYTAENITL